MLAQLLALAFAWAAAEEVSPKVIAADDECRGEAQCSLNALPEVIAADDECLGEAQCSLNALQLRATPDPTADGFVYWADGEWKAQEGKNASEEGLGESWSPGGDKMWGDGAGTENVNPGNVGYYNSGFAAAHARCGDAGCALIVNPPGHRTVNHFHIHFVHYSSYGANLKKALESKVCRSGGWHGGGLPCGGKATCVDGFPGVMSTAMRGGSVHDASVIAWPGACGGRGTIVELAFGCSIEHQIRGDFDPRFR